MKRLFPLALAAVLAALLLGGAVVAEDGDVLTYVDPQVGGKSQVFRGAPSRWLDLGTVTAAGVVAGGRQVLYTTADGELVAQVRFGDALTMLDHTAELAFGMEGIADLGNGIVKLAAIGEDDVGTNTFDTLQNAVNKVNFNAGAGAGGFAVTAVPLLSGTLIATLNQTPYVLGSSAGWQANHAYTGANGLGDPTAMVIAAGHMWGALSVGTSGGSSPDFAGNIDGFTPADGTVSGWNDAGLAPTAGSVHVYVEIIRSFGP